MRAFVAYSHGANVSHLFNILRNHGIQFFDGTYDLSYKGTFHNTWIEAIKSCDIFVLVYTEENENLAFEIGIAVALNIPIFSIFNTANDFLSDTVHVYANPDEYEKIKYNFDIFYKNLKIKEKKVTNQIISKQISKSKKWKSVYDSLEYKNSVGLEFLFSEIFSFHNINNARQHQNDDSNYNADFSIWVDELNPVLGNPILVEIESEYNRRNSRKAVERFEERIRISNAKSGIIFYEKAPNEVQENLKNKQNRNILVIKISDFIESLDSFGFAAAILKHRQNIFHKI